MSAFGSDLCLFRGRSIAARALSRLKLYDSAFHDLLNDFGKEAVMADIVNWIGVHAEVFAF
jgi:alpha-beta hydrolase superfamily lysophospholipase